MTHYHRLNHYEMTYTIKGEVHTVRCNEMQKNANLARIKASLNLKLISCRKLYPIKTGEHQHDFELVANRSLNELDEMSEGGVDWDAKTYDNLSRMADRAEYFLSMPIPVAWMPYEEWREATELCAVAAHMRKGGY